MYGQRNIEKLKINKLLFQINDRINIINIGAEKKSTKIRHRCCYEKKNLKFIGYSTELQSRFIVFSPFIFYVDFTSVLYITQTLSTLAFLWNFNPYVVIYRGWRLIEIGLLCYGYTFVQIKKKWIWHKRNAMIKKY